MTGATDGAGSAYLFRLTDITPVFQHCRVGVAQSFIFLVVFCRPLFVVFLSPFFLAIVLSVLPIMARARVAQ